MRQGDEDESQETTLENGTYTIGRKDRRRAPRLGPEARRNKRTNVIWLDHETVSNVHAELDILNEQYFLKDLNSTNGIFKRENGKKVRFKEGYVELDQELFLGECRCTVRELLERI